MNRILKNCGVNFERRVYEEEKDITLEAEDELAVTIYVQRT